MDNPRAHDIARHVQAIMRLLRLDPAEDPNLVGTPERVAELFLEVFSGLEPGSAPELTTFPNQDGTRQVVSLGDIPFYSLCAHHFAPFFGHALVAYVPGERLIGLSKLARVVDWFAHRPQVQERLTEQIADCLATELRPRGALVVLEARHLCMEMRGVRLPGTLATTRAVRGVFESDAGLREEVLQRVRR